MTKKLRMATATLDRKDPPMLAFTVYGEAIPQGSAKGFIPKGWSRPVITSDNVRLKSWRQLVAEAANHAVLARPAPDRTLFLDGVRLTIAFYLPRPKSLPKRSTAHTKKPDVDKLVRGVCDSLSAIVFRDDSQVCELLVTKQYAEIGRPPRVDIRVEATDGVTGFAGKPSLFDAVEAIH